MAYVPPHLRNKRDGGLQTAPSQRSLESLQKMTTASTDPIYRLGDITALLGCNESDLSTLTVSKAFSSERSNDPESPRILADDVLCAIIIFEGQHPEWESGHRILCKSNLRVLHNLVGDLGDQSEEVTSHALTITESTPEYPLFREIPFRKTKFSFAGWWRIREVKFLPPRSAELVALFEMKFNAQDGQSRNHAFAFQRGKSKMRTKGAWRDSFSREWAVVTLVRNDERKDLPKPVSKPIAVQGDPPKNPQSLELHDTDGTVGSFSI